MTALSLSALVPALQLMAAGALIALGPLAWWALRQRQASAAARLQALTVLTLFLTFDLVLFGAFTRLSDSGLGCPDWPGCYGHASPLGAQAEIASAEAALPGGPVTHGKAWVEMVHRYLATAVGVLILVLTLAAWRPQARGPQGARAGRGLLSPWWPTATLLWVCAQGAFGALTVTMKLFPAIVTLHLLGGIGLFALLSVQAVRYRQRAAAVRPVPVGPGLRAALWTTLLLVGVQSALGGWVSTNYAVLACDGFPTCQGRWWPAMDLGQGFELWRPLGHTGAGAWLALPALTAIHMVHRLAAGVVLLALAALALRLARVPALRAQARALGALALWQLASGLSNVVLDWPLAAALAHTGGAAALAGVLSWSLCSCRAAAAPEPRRRSLSRRPPPVPTRRNAL